MTWIPVSNCYFEIPRGSRHYRLASYGVGRRFIQDLETLVERPVKRFLFALDRFLDLLLFRTNFGKDAAHRFGDNIDKFEEERFVEFEGATVTNRTTQNPA